MKSDLTKDSAEKPARRPRKISSPTLASKVENEAAASLAGRSILILDPGYRSLTGHHHNMAVVIEQAARELGAKVHSLAGDTLLLPDEVAHFVDPFFVTDLYSGHSVFNESNEFDSWLHVNTSFKKDLNKITDELLSSHDIILVPAITQFHMQALADWIVDVAVRQPKLKFAIQLMFSPTWTAWDNVCKSGPHMYVEAFETLQLLVGTTVFYFSELPSSCSEFEPLTSCKVGVLSHAGLWDKPVSKHADRGTIQVGYFGYAKREKGFHLLPELIETVLESDNKDITFTIHVNHGNYDGAIIAAHEALTLLEGPRVTLQIGPMELNDYVSLFDEVDLVLLPYDPELYRGRGSGVMSEAIGFGKIVVAPAQTGVGEEIAIGRGAGVLYRQNSAKAAASSLLVAASNISLLRDQAYKAAEIWRRNHSGEAYLSVVGAIL